MLLLLLLVMCFSSIVVLFCFGRLFQFTCYNLLIVLRLSFGWRFVVVYYIALFFCILLLLPFLPKLFFLRFAFIICRFLNVLRCCIVFLFFAKYLFIVVCFFFLHLACVGRGLEGICTKLAIHR